jgi:DNA mismatch endonuclease (patch repair protein)
MSAVRTKDTGPELVVRQILTRLGYRYRLHRKDLPGRPDIVFPRRKKVIFVHGCFWHGHECDKGRAPKSRLEYWSPKLEANRERDAANVARLEGAGWEILIVWQCETRDREALEARLAKFVDGIEKSIDNGG